MMRDHDYITRPLTDEAKLRLADVTKTTCPFRATWSATLDLLDREMRFLRPKNHEFVVMVDITERDLRLDGMLRADARPASPNVAIAVETIAKGDLLFTCGKFYDWKDNVRAIALSLEALRRVDRYGITKSNEQYRGWQALPPGATPMPARMTADEAARLLRTAAGWTDDLVIGNAEDIQICFRDAALRHHPDRGGDTAYFQQLVEARDLLKGAA